MDLEVKDFKLLYIKGQKRKIYIHNVKKGSQDYGILGCYYIQFGR